MKPTNALRHRLNSGMKPTNALRRRSVFSDLRNCLPTNSNKRRAKERILLGYSTKWRIGRRNASTSETLKGSAVLSWAGMPGIVTLASSFAVPLTLPDGLAFPHRDLIFLCAAVTVLGTLVVQGLTLGFLIKAIKLPADDPVRAEVS
jgi:hypothetical protein